MKTVILPKPHHEIFEDAAKSFAAEPGEDTLCFGVIDWSFEQIQEQRNLAKGKFIAYQTEQIHAYLMLSKNYDYVARLRLFDEVWDYSECNLEHLTQLQLPCVRYKPLLPSPVLKDTPQEKDIDILHYGTWSRHRTAYLNCAVKQGFSVYDVLREKKKMLYGDELHQLILRSKVVLGLHSYPQFSIQEGFRYQYPLSNDIKVLAEKSLSNPLNLEEFADADEMVEKLGQWVTPVPIAHDEFVEKFIFAQHSSYLEEAENYCQSEELSDRLAYVAKYMNSDLEMANEMRRLAKRSEDVKAVELKVFDDLMRVSLLLIRQRNALGKQASSFSCEFGRIYHKLQKNSVKNVLLSTGGKAMPRLRCLLLLHGWSLMKMSLRMSMLIHKDQKLIRFVSKG